jgi:hypothetical protein
LDRYPAWFERLFEEVHLQFVTGIGKPQYKTCITARRLNKLHVIPGGLEGKADMLGDLRQRSMIPGGEVQIL